MKRLRRPRPVSLPPEVSAPEPRTRPAPRRSYRVGQILFGLGAALILLGIGSIAGYWLADAGTRWLPQMLGGLIGVGMLALVAMIAGLFLIGPYAGRELGRRRIVALTALLLVGGVVRVAVHWAGAPKPLTRMSKRTFHAGFEADRAQVAQLSATLAGLHRALEGRVDLFPADGRPPPVASADEERFVIDVWAGFVDTAFALDQIRAFYEDYFAFDLSRPERDRHVRSFLLTFAAELALYAHTAAIIGLLDRNPNVVKLLELGRRDRGLRAGSVTWVREELLGLTDLARVTAGKRYQQWLAMAHGADVDARARGYGALWDDVRARLERLDDKGTLEMAATSVGADLGPLMREVKARTFPVQAGVAAFLGDFKVKRKGRYLIDPEALDEMRGALAPGDVMLARKNWYLSNVGLPGFWPHALLWVGTRAELAAAFDDDPTVTAWIERRTGRAERFTAYIERRYPAAWQAMEKAEASGGSLPVIEAISEGVVQSTLKSAAGDYLVALRPRLPAWTKARAIDFAFRQLGRPYDFDFDFATDHALVCTELVWRAYRARHGTPGLRIPPVVVAGRKTLPANEIARVFAAEMERPDRQLDFVYYLEGSEAQGTAVAGDRYGFAATHQRSKWDFAQE